MFNGNLTLLDLATTNRTDPLTGLVESVTTFAPEFSVIPAERRPGTWYKTVQRTALPTANFRQVNQGLTPTKSTYKQQIKEMFFLDIPLTCDEAIVKGDDKSSGDILTHEAMGAVQSAIIKIGSQTWYGAANDGSNGFVGIRQQLAGVTYASGSSSAYATSTTSAYGLWLNPWGVHFDVGRDGEIALPPWQRQYVADPTVSGAGQFQWVTNLSSYIGLAVIDPNSAWAVTGIDTTESSTLNTLTGLPILARPLSDAKVAQMVSSIALARRTGLVWFTSRQGLYTLQRSRSAVGTQPASSANGTPAWSPPSESADGFPVVVTDSISTTENNS